MLLHKPQVYRHLLFNRLAFKNDDSAKLSNWGRLGRLGSGPLPWGVLKLSLLLIFFEVYIKWAKKDHMWSINQALSKLDFGLKYVNLLALSFTGIFNLPFHTILRFWVRICHISASSQVFICGPSGVGSSLSKVNPATYFYTMLR